MYNRIQEKTPPHFSNFDMICENIMRMQDYVEESGSDCVVATYHLITDNDNQEEELEALNNQILDDLINKKTK
mgnify:CR=1 FL=1